MTTITTDKSAKRAGSRLGNIKSAIIILALTLGLLGTASAVDDWISGTGDWNNPANWNGGVPNTSDLTIIRNGGTATISVSPPTIAQFDGGYGGVNQTGGTLTTDG